MSKKEQTIIVRCCVGCVIPEYSTLIGSGTYILKRTGTIIIRVTKFDMQQ